MSYALDMDSEVRTLVRHLPPRRKKIIKESFRAIAKDPSLGKPLRENLQGLYSYRVGSLRIIYSIHKSKKTVHIIALGPRRNIYEALEKEMRQKK